MLDWKALSVLSPTTWYNQGSLTCSIESSLSFIIIFYQNLRNRRYYISGHQVSRSVSKSSGTIGSHKKKTIPISYICIHVRCINNINMMLHTVIPCKPWSFDPFVYQKIAERMKKRVHRRNETGTNDTKVPLQGVISPHMHESCPLADIISRSIFQPFHIHEGFKTIPRNDTKTIPISDPFCVSKTMTHVYRVQHRVFFWCFPQVPRKSTPSSKLFSL